jgi:hypothetical protein
MLDPTRPYLWSSATLYDAATRQTRQQWFEEWLNDRVDFSQEAIMEFHRTAGRGDDWNGVVMNREGKVQTVSITSLVKSPGCAQMHYFDLLRQSIKKAQIQLKGELAAVSF